MPFPIDSYIIRADATGRRSRASLDCTAEGGCPHMSIADASIFHRNAILLNLAEYPWVRRRGPPNHYGIAAGLFDHGAGVFGRADIAVPDHGNLYCSFDGGDP